MNPVHILKHNLHMLHFNIPPLCLGLLVISSLQLSRQTLCRNSHPEMRATCPVHLILLQSIAYILLVKC